MNPNHSRTMKITSTSFKVPAQVFSAPVPSLTAFVSMVMLGMLLPWLAGCQGTKPVYPTSTAAAEAAAASMTVNTSTPLREGDVVKITYEADTNMNVSVKIQLDGNISAALIGDVKAAGKTPVELQTDLMKRYERLLKVNDITVTLISSAASIYVTGAVLKPGRFAMDRPMTALDAIMEAGGFDPTQAKPSAVMILRVENGQQQHYELNLKRALKGEDSSLFYLKPYDIVHVPEKTFNF